MPPSGHCERPERDNEEASLGDPVGSGECRPVSQNARLKSGPKLSPIAGIGRGTEDLAALLWVCSE